jgi:hypothetical protein
MNRSWRESDHEHGGHTVTPPMLDRQKEVWVRPLLRPTSVRM